MTSLQQNLVWTATVALLVAVICLVTAAEEVGWNVPRAVLSGRVFDRNRPLVIGGALDQSSLQKEFFIFAYSCVVVLGPIALVNRLNRRSDWRLRCGISVVSLGLLAHPASVLLIFTWDLSRYIHQMGLTTARVRGLLTALVCWVALGCFAFWVCHFRREGRKVEPTGAVLTGHEAGAETVRIE
jgi:hypothetical protein